MVTQTILHTVQTGIIARVSVSRGYPYTSGKNVRSQLILYSLTHTATTPPYATQSMCESRFSMLNTFLQGWNGKSFFPEPRPLKSHRTHRVLTDAAQYLETRGFKCHGHQRGQLSTLQQKSWYPSSSHSLLGQPMALVMCTLLLRQYGRGHRAENSHFKGCTHHALTKMSRFLRSALWFRDTVLPLTECTKCGCRRHRINLTVIPSLFPQATQQTISQAILDLLVLQIPDWGSPTLFKVTLTMAYPPPLEPSTIPAGLDSAPQ